MRLYRILIAAGYISIFLLVLLAAYIFHNEQHTLELLEQKNNTTNGLRKSINRLNMQIAGLSFLGETVMEWTDSDKEEYHFQRMVIDSTLCSFRNVFRSEQKGIDSLRRILANKESQLNDLAALYLRQKTLHRQIADRVPECGRSRPQAETQGISGFVRQERGRYAHIRHGHAPLAQQPCDSGTEPAGQVAFGADRQTCREECHA